MTLVDSDRPNLTLSYFGLKAAIKSRRVATVVKKELSWLCVCVYQIYVMFSPWCRQHLSLSVTPLHPGCCNRPVLNCLAKKPVAQVWFKNSTQNHVSSKCAVMHNVYFSGKSVFWQQINEHFCCLTLHTILDSSLYYLKLPKIYRNWT